MPIRPEMRPRYPKDWPEISREVREAAGWRCEECRVPDGAWGWREPGGRFIRVNKRRVRQVGLAFHVEEVDGSRRKVFRIVLTVAHLDHVPENVGTPGVRPNLRAWCQRCHNRYDGPTRVAGIKARRAAEPLPLFEGLEPTTATDDTP